VMPEAALFGRGDVRRQEGLVAPASLLAPNPPLWQGTPPCRGALSQRPPHGGSPHERRFSDPRAIRRICTEKPGEKSMA
jgi:hypothetical protein